MTEINETEKCINSDVILPLDSKEPCHNCGSTGKKRIMEVNERRVIRESGFAETTKTTKKTSYPLLIIMFSILFVSTLTGYFTTNTELGVIIGIILGLVTWYVGKDSTMIEKFRNRTNF